MVTLVQPPLRERIGDNPLLAEHYLKEFVQQTGKHVSGFSSEAMQLMQTLPLAWECSRVGERGGTCCGAHQTHGDSSQRSARGLTSGRPCLETQLATTLSGNNLKAALAHPERQIILDALEAHGWNRQKTARLR
ncbi:MAG: hypothetical protein KatS3mg114_0003 [Planctomycetaceae bacterium]|nr:MAG: hypothetical protein KatS3mg114_0003 [Planctomycetaceae bacterium]